MRWFRRAFEVLSPADRAEAEIGEELLYLHHLVKEAEENGAQFRPAARLARQALKAIHWL
jgi:hypothetical protein